MQDGCTSTQYPSYELKQHWKIKIKTAVRVGDLQRTPNRNGGRRRTWISTRWQITSVHCALWGTLITWPSKRPIARMNPAWCGNAVIILGHWAAVICAAYTWWAIKVHLSPKKYPQTRIVRTASKNTGVGGRQGDQVSRPKRRNTKNRVKAGKSELSYNLNTEMALQRVQSRI